MARYRTTIIGIERKAKALLSRMTLDEKLAQLGGVWSNELLDDDRFSVEKAKNVIRHGIGQISRPATASGLSPEELVTFVNRIQHFLIEGTRLAIPAIMHEECLNGFMARGATVFPQNIGLASTWEPELVGRMTQVIRGQMRAVGIHQGLSPVLDIARDPRWGRTEETFGEDPYLVGRMAVAYVKGLQGDDIKTGVIATPKHFVGYGLSEGGLNWAPSHIPPRLLHEVYLYPFEKAVREGGALSLMNSYQEIDGIPCAASEELISRVLRQQWGFKGIVVSDYFAIERLLGFHKVAADKGEAARLALTAGIDIELPRHDCYGDDLKALIESGLVSEDLINRAVIRILKIKLMLGLFENPYVPETKPASKLFDLPAHRQLALEAARKSIVLLKNDGNLLPLKKRLKAIAVIGPNADSYRNLLGDYTYPAHAEFVGTRRKRETTPAQTDDREHTGDVRVVSILEGIQQKVSGNTRVLYARGCEVSGTSTDGFPESTSAAKVAEVAIIVVGGKSGLSPDCTSGEMRDSAELSLPGVQKELVEAIVQTGTPVVVVLVNGRPLALEWLTEKVSAILQAWLPGEEGGNALADILFGDYNPGGKLSVSMPRRVGQVPVYYGHKPSGGRSQIWGDYVDSPTTPLFCFGHGLSYTTFVFRNLKIKPKKIRIMGETKISVDVTNDGAMAGDEVVQLYIQDEVASVTRPVKELKGFQRIHLQPKETKSAVFRLAADELAFYNKDMKCVVEPGTFRVMVGRSSEDIMLEGSFEVIV